MSKGAGAACVWLLVGAAACGTKSRADTFPDAGASAGGTDAGATNTNSGGSVSDAGDEVGFAGQVGEAGAAGAPQATPLPSKAEISATLRLVNDAWMKSHPAPGDDQWARAVYFVGDCAFAQISGRDAELTYAKVWAESHAYGLNGGSSTTDANNQCAGQTYLTLADAEPDPNKLTALEVSLTAMTAAKTADAWTWIDALFMALPTFVQLGAHDHDPIYFDEAFRLYDYTKRTVGGGLYNASDALWYRDPNYKPPHLEPNGKSTYWSRGNGWVFAAHARVLAVLPETDAHYAEYLSTFQAMAAALARAQRSDGFWNVSLFDPTHFGGPETSGTALFTYGLGLGVARGWIPREPYEDVVSAAYHGLASIAVNADGTVGYIQGAGAAPESAQPVTASSNSDFGVGALLMAGTAVYELASD